jgi:hypothetical protein
VAMQHAGFYRTYDNYLNVTDEHMIVYCNQYDDGFLFNDTIIFEVVRKLHSIQGVYSSHWNIMNDLREFVGGHGAYGVKNGRCYPFSILFSEVL